MSEMEKITGNSPEAKSLDITQQNIEQLKEIFPDVFSENKIDFEALKAVLGAEVDDSEERYNFTWNGKTKARQLAQTPSTGTLRPSKEESVNWDTTENLFIEGDNLEVLKLLQKSYHKKVKMIYIDPPYNTGSDFVYKDNFRDNIQNYLEQTNQVDGQGNKLSTNSDTSGRYHSDWLNMMYPRLKLARNLLKDDGVLFISIDDNEVANLRKICDEIFGEGSFVTTIQIEMSATQGMKVKAAKAGNIVKNGEFILVYSKDGHKNIGNEPLLAPSSYDNHYSLYMNKIEDDLYEEVTLSKVIKDNSYLVEELIQLGLIESSKSSIDFKKCYQYSPALKKYIDENAYRIVRTHDSIELPESFTKTIIDSYIRSYDSKERSYLVSRAKNGSFYQKIRLSDKLKKADDFAGTFGPTRIRGNWWDGFYLDMGNVSKEGGVSYNNGKKPVRLLKQLIKFCCNGDDLILDFFAGSATTGHATVSLNEELDQKNRFILVQMPEPLSPKSHSQKESYDFCKENNLPPFVSELSKERLRRVSAKSNDNKSKIDNGFKVLKLDETNIRPWDADFDNLEQVLREATESIKSDRSNEDVLYEILLKYGIELTVPIETEIVNGKKIFIVGAGALIVCLDDGITGEVVEGIAKLKDELDPETTQVVFKDAGFADSNVKTNAIQILKQAGIDDVKSI